MLSTKKPWLTDSKSLRKKELRQEVGARLAKIPPEEVRRQSDIVVKKVLSSEWFNNANRICVYLHTAGEIETDRIVEKSLEQGKQLFIPQFIRKDPQMRMLRVPTLRDFKELKPTLWGIRQPAVEQHWENYEESGSLDLIIVPGVAFTLTGDRLGHGMGYYDRALVRHQQRFGTMPIRYGLALREQIVDVVPLAETDVRLDGVIRAE
uniref:5-formyltetrahydrofolate cyclo-ligase n=1 Tax=Angiostrongylus cantonensis TaxID=6313 RepID=A0A0K0CYA5_ANGCA